jgi:hypothetical protein
MSVTIISDGRYGNSLHFQIGADKRPRCHFIPGWSESTRIDAKYVCGVLANCRAQLVDR